MSLILDAVRVQRGGRPVLHGVSLEVPAGEVTALLGPNGAGKSTLVLAAGGVLPITGGSFTLAGTELAGRRPDQVRSAGLAIAPEGRQLLRGLSVADNLQVATYALSKADAKQGMGQALELFPELKQRWKVPARLLSGGEQQMVVLAQALVCRPKALIIDELSLGLAPVVVKRLMPALTAAAQAGVAVLLIEQFAHVALGASVTAHIIESGRLRYSGTAAELREKPELMSSAYLLRDEPAERVGEVRAGG